MYEAPHAIGEPPIESLYHLMVSVAFNEAAFDIVNKAEPCPQTVLPAVIGSTGFAIVTISIVEGLAAFEQPVVKLVNTKETEVVPTLEILVVAWNMLVPEVVPDKEPDGDQTVL